MRRILSYLHRIEGRFRSGTALFRTGSIHPVSRQFGLDRGEAIDRHYIQTFLAKHSRLIRGRVLEFGEDSYTISFGGSAVDSADILDFSAQHPRWTYSGDISDGAHIPSTHYDCIICTQTLMFLPRPDDAIRHMHRILKPGGMLLLTAAGISQISRFDSDRWGDYWRFTPQGLQLLLGKSFERTDIEIATYGNVATCAAFLYGFSAEEVIGKLDANDPDYPMIVAATARRSEKAIP